MRKHTIWDEMRRMQRDMDSLFSDFFHAEPSYLLKGSKDSKNEISSVENYREPICDIKEDKEKYNLSLELPGSKKEEKQEDKEKGHYSYSRSYLGFYRSFKLPRNIDQNNIDAEYKDGVLNLKIPKKEISSSQKLIEVK